MNTTSKALGLVLLALSATLSHAGSARLQAAPGLAINPQPLPPRHVDSKINPLPLPPSQAESMVRIAINPQPLPPSQAESRVRIAINPQPLPPRGSDPALRNSLPKPYIA